MHIVQVCEGAVPPKGYGGIERIVFWLSRELLRRGHGVTVISGEGSTVADELPGAMWRPYPSHGDIRGLLPQDADVVHFHTTPAPETLPYIPFLVTEHGNRRKGSAYAPNTVFLSRSHAVNHNAPLWVPNGVPVDEYPLCDSKADFMLFMAKLAWRKKNAKTAIALSLDSGMPLQVAGGSLWRTRKIWGLWMARALFSPRLLTEVGEVGGSEKLHLLQQARLLFYLVNWQEPFALAPHEALACGTPVLASPNGALPEYIEHGRNGFLVSSYDEALEVVRHVHAMSTGDIAAMARRCRDSAYTASAMTDRYLELYAEAAERGHLYPPELARGFHFTRPRSVIIKPPLF